jgi:acyl-CoA thioester hydrolase
MFCFETKVRVRYAETDQMGVVYHSNFFLYYEVSRAESIRQLGFTYADMEKIGVIMPVIEVQSKFLRPALYDDLLVVKTILKELPRDHKIEFDHEVYNQREELLATGKIVLYFVDATTKKRTTMPAELRKKIEPYFS